MSRSEILAAIPHRPPFLLIDEIVEQDERRIVCRKTFLPDEWFFAGHYPEHPVVPGVLLCEAAMQAGAVLLAQHDKASQEQVPVAARMQDVRFKRMVRPGETIEISVEITEHLSKAWYLSARVSSQDKAAVTFNFACTLAPKSE
jgi:3-hydroxyacyl-[acyl-carrier-protein] dehydratase